MIFKLCIPFCAGVAAAAILMTALPNVLGTCHVVNAFLAATAFITLGTILSGKERSRNQLLWGIMFFLTGALCYANSCTLAPCIVRHDYLAGTSEAMKSVIRSIPFKTGEDNALVLAIVCGDRTALSRETVGWFRTSGAAHLLALSGMHLGIIYLIVAKALGCLGNSPVLRHFRSIASIAITGAYTVMCGAGASLVRAWLFILLNESARLLYRKQPPQHIFCTALTLHLATNPLKIAEAGFQLSYLAMLGIVFLWPHIRGWMNSKIWEGASLCISCQLFTGPLSYWYFGTFPTFFLITNLIAAPLMTIVMVSGIIATASCASGIEAQWLYGICEIPLEAMRLLMKTIASI